MKHTIEVDGYYRDCRRGFLPQERGIYFVFTCKCDCNKQELEVKKLIYVGCTPQQTIQERVCTHDKISEFGAACNPGEGFCYACSILHDAELRNVLMIENALIFAEQPLLNTMGKENYSHADIEIELKGKVDYLPVVHFEIKDGVLNVIK